MSTTTSARLRSAHHRVALQDHHVERDGHRGLQPVHHHAERIADQDDVAIAVDAGARYGRDTRSASTIGSPPLRARMSGAVSRLISSCTDMVRNSQATRAVVAIAPSPPRERGLKGSATNTIGRGGRCAKTRLSARPLSHPSTPINRDALSHKGRGHNNCLRACGLTSDDQYAGRPNTGTPTTRGWNSRPSAR